MLESADDTLERSVTFSTLTYSVINQHSINLHYSNGLDLTDPELLNF